MQKNWQHIALLLLISIACVALTRWIPFHDFFRNVNTMIHEMGHALMTLIFSGRVSYIELYANHGGVTLSSFSKGWHIIPIALAGYVSASLYGLLSFKLMSKGKYVFGLSLLLLITVVTLVFVRNAYGVGWLIFLTAVTGAVLLLGSDAIKKYYFIFIAFLQLVDSVASSFTLLRMTFLHPEMHSDAVNLREATYVPAIIWALLFFIFALYCFAQSMRLFVGMLRQKYNEGSSPSTLSQADSSRRRASIHE